MLGSFLLAEANIIQHQITALYYRDLHMLKKWLQVFPWLTVLFWNQTSSLGHFLKEVIQTSINIYSQSANRLMPTFCVRYLFVKNRRLLYYLKL